MFPGAEVTVSEPSYAIIGAPLDATTTFYPGTRFGPERIRHFSRHFDDFDHVTGRYFTDLSVVDHGDVTPDEDVSEYLEFLRSTVVGYQLDGGLPLLLGGEHTISLAGVRATEPSTFVVIDAHLDLRDRYDGNPLNHATTTRRVLEEVDDVIIIGARTGSQAEWERAREDDVTVVSPSEALSWQPDIDGPCYLSIDIDGIEPATAPGTGTREPFGLEVTAVRDLITQLAPSCVGFDIVEVNDRDHGQAATVAGKLLRRFVYDHADATSV